MESHRQAGGRQQDSGRSKEGAPEALYVGALLFVVGRRQAQAGERAVQELTEKCCPTKAAP